MKSKSDTPLSNVTKDSIYICNIKNPAENDTKESKMYMKNNNENDTKESKMYMKNNNEIDDIKNREISYDDKETKLMEYNKFPIMSSLNLYKSNRKRAQITGITGQDGSYLVEQLLSKNYEVHGLVRMSSSYNIGRIEHILKNSKQLYLHYGDITDISCLTQLCYIIQPEEVYNLAAQSHVGISFDTSIYTSQVTGFGVLCLLNALRICNLHNKVKFYQASTSEIYGKVLQVPQTEKTPFYPRSPYAVAKVFAYWICVNYRESYNMFICNGIAFNHESSRRGTTFVTRKTTLAVARIVKNLQTCLYLGNIDAKRDWGHAKDYVEGMWRMLQEDTPDDYVIATKCSTSVRTFVEKAFKYVGIQLKWKGSGIDEVGYDAKDDRILVRIDPKLYRPSEVNALIGDPSKAKRVSFFCIAIDVLIFYYILYNILQILKWEPKTTLDELIADMMEHDLKTCDNTNLQW